MKECPKCQTQNRELAHFCKHCSQPLAADNFCPNCGLSNSLTAHFCKGCGSQLSPKPPGLPQHPASPKHPTPVPLEPLLSATSPAVAPQTGKLPPKTKVGDRYEIVTLIGQGGMGAVYLVMDNRLGNKRCALKEMSDSGIHDPAERQRAIHAFKQEAQILSNLSHPGLPRVTDFFSQANKHFLVMDYVDGQSLLELLESRTTPFPASRVLDWGLQLCDVLEYLHRQVPPIIYRDLKPENIIASTNRERVRLIDFGAARTYKPQQGKDTTAIGTPGYAPPEQYGKGQTDARSDVYALGATLHQLLTLHDPGVKLFDFPPVRSLNSSVPKEIEVAIDRALEENIHKRWSSISEFKKALQSQEQKPAPKPKPSAPRVATSTVPAVAGKSVPGATPAHVVSKPVPSPQSSIPVTKGKCAGYGSRFWAYVIDNLILTAGGFLIAVPFLNASSGDAMAFMFFTMAVWAIGYYTYFHAKTGQTPGKKVNRVKVICRDGSKLTWPRAFWRSLVLLVSSAFIGILWYIGWLLYLIPLVDKDNRALHDFLAGTWVVEA